MRLVTPGAGYGLSPRSNMHVGGEGVPGEAGTRWMARSWSPGVLQNPAPPAAATAQRCAHVATAARNNRGSGREPGGPFASRLRTASLPAALRPAPHRPFPLPGPPAAPGRPATVARAHRGHRLPRVTPLPPATPSPPSRPCPPILAEHRGVPQRCSQVPGSPHAGHRVGGPDRRGHIGWTPGPPAPGGPKPGRSTWGGVHSGLSVCMSVCVFGGDGDRPKRAPGEGAPLGARFNSGPRPGNRSRGARWSGPSLWTHRRTHAAPQADLPVPPRRTREPGGCHGPRPPVGAGDAGR